MFQSIYSGKRIFVTGHTGFKGSWLSLWLTHMGAQVAGFSVNIPTEPAHINLLGLPLAADTRASITTPGAVRQALQSFKPDLVIHMAAQPLVRLSYAEPVTTFETNVMGTVHVLEACRNLPGLKGIVNITSDKCYENTGTKPEGFTETDPMGGHDPYSASKGAAEIVAASYARAFADLPPLANARAGNVIGGGDWALDRLVPDAARAMAAGTELIIRRPSAIRPWQHVLEPLSGYLLLGQLLLQSNPLAKGGWNFAPTPESTLTVDEVLKKLQAHMPFTYRAQTEGGVHEASLLTLSNAKAKKELGWSPVWNADTALAHTASWYQAHHAGTPVPSLAQLQEYIASARAAGQAWAT